MAFERVQQVRAAPRRVSIGRSLDRRGRSATIASQQRARCVGQARDGARRRTGRCCSRTRAPGRRAASLASSVRSNLAASCRRHARRTAGWPAESGRAVGARVGVHAEHDLEQRPDARLRAGLSALDQLFERHVLVGLGVEVDRLDRCQVVGEARIAAAVGAQHQGVDEEADQVLELGAAGGWRPACRSPCRRCRRWRASRMLQRAVQHHEQGRAAAPAPASPAPRASAAPISDRHGARPRSSARAGRGRSSGRLCTAAAPASCALPVAELLLEHLARSHCRCHCGVVGVAGSPAAAAGRRALLQRRRTGRTNSRISTPSTSRREAMWCMLQQQHSSSARPGAGSWRAASGRPPGRKPAPASARAAPARPPAARPRRAWRAGRSAPA